MFLVVSSVVSPSFNIPALFSAIIFVVCFCVVSCCWCVY